MTRDATNGAHFGIPRFPINHILLVRICLPDINCTMPAKFSPAVLMSLVLIVHQLMVTPCETTAAPKLNPSIGNFVQQLEHDGQLLWHCEISMGTSRDGAGDEQAAQRFRVLIDTGSSELWLVSKSCTSEICLARRRFDAALSSSLIYSNNRTIRVDYGGGGTVKGIEAKDRLRLAELTIEEQSFLLVESMAGSVFERFQFDGVLGLGWKFNSKLKALTPFEQMIKRDLIGERVFSLYLDSATHLGDKGSAGGGELIFGEHLLTLRLPAALDEAVGQATN